MLIADCAAAAAAAAAAFNDAVTYILHHRPSTFIVPSTDNASIHLHDIKTRMKREMYRLKF